MKIGAPPRAPLPGKAANFRCLMMKPDTSGATRSSTASHGSSIGGASHHPKSGGKGLAIRTRIGCLGHTLVMSPDPDKNSLYPTISAC